MIFRGKIHNPGISYKFTTSKREAPKKFKYTWVLSDWSQCSTTCGGGVQHQEALCQESVISTVPSVVDGTSTIVDEAMCDPDKQPERVMRACNVDPCPSHWWFGPWQSCPVTCTEKVWKNIETRKYKSYNRHYWHLLFSFVKGYATIKSIYRLLSRFITLLKIACNKNCSIQAITFDDV